jgi:hypothetical protein
VSTGDALVQADPSAASVPDFKPSAMSETRTALCFTDLAPVSLDFFHVGCIYNPRKLDVPERNLRVEALVRLGTIDSTRYTRIVSRFVGTTAKDMKQHQSRYTLCVEAFDLAYRPGKILRKWIAVSDLLCP